MSSPNFFDLDPILSDQGKAVPFKGDSSDITVDLALKFIRECAQKKQRFLAVVWFGSPHAPHQALPADAALYADLPKEKQHFCGEITAMDRAFGKLRTSLRELGLRDQTVLWYCSDNGALPKVGSSGGRRGNKGQIYEGGLLVPALLEWPARGAAAARGHPALRHLRHLSHPAGTGRRDRGQTAAAWTASASCRCSTGR